MFVGDGVGVSVELGVGVSVGLGVGVDAGTSVGTTDVVGVTVTVAVGAITAENSSPCVIQKKVTKTPRRITSEIINKISSLIIFFSILLYQISCLIYHIII